MGLAWFCSEILILFVSQLLRDVVELKYIESFHVYPVHRLLDLLHHEALFSLIRHPGGTETSSIRLMQVFLAIFYGLSHNFGFHLSDSRFDGILADQINQVFR